MSEYKTVDVPPDQSYEYQVFGDKSKWVITKYFWHGHKWEELARALAYSNMPVYIMNFFLGSTINEQKKTISIRGSFTKEVFLNKYAPRLITNPHFHDVELANKKRTKEHSDPYEDSRLWSFILSGKKRVKLPAMNEKFDELSYHVNGFELSDEWQNWQPNAENIEGERAEPVNR